MKIASASSTTTLLPNVTGRGGAFKSVAAISSPDLTPLNDVRVALARDQRRLVSRQTVCLTPRDDQGLGVQFATSLGNLQMHMVGNAERIAMLQGHGAADGMA